MFEIYKTVQTSVYINISFFQFLMTWGHHGRDRMVIGFTTIYAMTAYHH